MKRFVIVTSILLLILVWTTGVHATEPPDRYSWITRNPVPTGSNILKVRFIEGVFYAIGYWGANLTSTDGVNWKPMRVPPEAFYWDITYGDGKYALVDARGSILISLDGKIWKKSLSADLETCIWSIGYYGGLFVAVGKNSSIFQSPDGITWQRVHQGPSSDGPLTAIAYGNGRFVAVGGGQTWDWEYRRIFTSLDGKTWTETKKYPKGFLPNYVFFDGTRFLAADFSIGVIAASTDGLSWKEIGASEAHPDALCYVNGTYVGVGMMGIYTSPDALSWTSRLELGEFFTVAAGNGIIVAAGKAGILYTSTDDGLTWTNAGNGSPSNVGDVLHGVLHGQAGYLAYGLDRFETQAIVYTSSDGKSWTRKVIREATSEWESAFLHVGTYGAGKYIVAGTGGICYVSTDLASWTEVPIPNGSRILSLQYGEGKFVAGGIGSASQLMGGHIFVSEDGFSWREVAKFNNPPLCFTYGKGKFVGLCGKELYSSPDGINWTESRHKAPGGNGYFGGAAFNGDTFAAISSDGNIIRSADGVKWKKATKVPKSDSGYVSVTWGSGLFLALTMDYDDPERLPFIYSSTDGITWKKSYIANGQYFLGATITNRYVTLVGTHETILQAPILK